MKIKDKLKALLQSRSAFGQQKENNNKEKKEPRKRKKGKMAYKRNAVTSKSMVDLTGPETRSSDQKQQQTKQPPGVLRTSTSYWNVDSGRTYRRKPPAPEPPPRVTIDSPQASSSSSKLNGIAEESSSKASEGTTTDLPRPKRVSSVQFADLVDKEAVIAEEEEPEDDDEGHREPLDGDVFLAAEIREHRSSTGSSTSASTSLGTFSSGGAGGTGGGFLPQAQSMMHLSRYQKSSYTSDEEPKGFRKKPSSALHALKNLSRSTPAMSPSASPRHSDSEGPPRVSKGTKKFMRHFADAPPSERVLNYFACALVSDILLQGTLYITPNYFAFYSKIFGHVSRLLIPISQVASVQKERTAKIIPNAVGLQTVDGKSYVFGSLLSRDSTYKLMTHLWKKAQMIQDSDSEPPSGVPLAVEDDCDDSGSGSGESFADEDHPDGGAPYLPSSAISTLTGVASSAAAPWARDTVITNTSSSAGGTTTLTAAASAESSTILTSPNIAVASSTTCSSTNNALPSFADMSGASSVALRRDSLTASKTSPDSKGRGASLGGGLVEWFTEGTLVKTCFRMGSVPLKLIGEGMREIWALPRTSLLLLISTMLLLMLFASAAFMLHRVDMLSQQLGLEKYDEYDGMYEEVLQMQQRLHAAASSEIEKTLSIQLKHIATVRQSLEALVVLFNKEPAVNTARIPDNT